ncbi:hypothetical protein ACGH7X_14685 [Streptomyces sp. BBFR51]
MTEGFRTIRTGEHMCFNTTATSPGQAEFAIRPDQPDPAEYQR